LLFHEKMSINEGERNSTAADVEAVYLINRDETEHSARNRMLANSHAGMATRLPPTWKLARSLNTSAFLGTNPPGRTDNFRLARHPPGIGKRTTKLSPAANSGRPR
jgi:hypothetical protein